MRVLVNGMRLEHVLEVKYFSCALNESGTDEAKCHRKVVSGKKVKDAFRSLVCRLSELGACMRYCSCLFLFNI